MSVTNFQPYPSELDRLLKAPGGPVGRHVNYVARGVAETARQIARERGLVRTGRYVRGFKVEVQPDATYGFVFYVVNRVTGQDPRRKESYAGVIEFGSVKHPIRPRRRDKWLVFRLPDGRMVKTKLVNHPGTQPQHVLRDAMIRAGQRSAVAR
jgi:hypothetical protein